MRKSIKKKKKSLKETKENRTVKFETIIGTRSNQKCLNKVG